MTGAYRHYDLFRYSAFYMAVMCMLYVEKTRELVFNFHVDKNKGNTCELILKTFSFSLSAKILMHHDTAACGHWTSYCIIEGASYAHDELNGINNETDPKKRRIYQCKKINLIYTFFAATGVEFPSGKVMHIGRLVDMNDLKDKGAEKSYVTTTSGNKSFGKNSEISQENCFSMCPPSVMHIASGVKSGED